MSRQMQFQSRSASQQQMLDDDSSLTNFASAGVQQKCARRAELRTNMERTRQAPVERKQGLSEEQKALSKTFLERAFSAPVEELRGLLKQGAYPNTKDDETGDYAVHKIMSRAGEPKMEFAKMLFEESHPFEVDINVKDKRGWTMLHFACDEEDTELSKFLLSKGADPNIQDSEGNTPLHQLASKSQISSANEQQMEQCLSYGGNIEIANNSGRLPNQITGHNVHQRLFMQQKIDFDENVIGGDVEVALSWTNMNDLDLHCTCRCKNHIYYGGKVCNGCKGFLDVDENRSPNTNTPVEHIYWPKIVPGKFQMVVHHYRNHSGVPLVSDYLVIMKVKEEIVFEKAGVLNHEKDEDIVLTFEFDMEENIKILENHPKIGASSSGPMYTNMQSNARQQQQVPRQRTQIPQQQMQQQTQMQQRPMRGRQQDQI